MVGWFFYLGSSLVLLVYFVDGEEDDDDDGYCLLFVLCFVYFCFKNGDRFGDSLFCLRPIERNKSSIRHNSVLLLTLDIFVEKDQHLGVVEVSDNYGGGRKGSLRGSLATLALAVIVATWPQPSLPT